MNETVPDRLTAFFHRRPSGTAQSILEAEMAIFVRVNATMGALNWKFKTGDVVHASPAIADGILFIGSWDSYFYALDAATGQQRWRFKTGEDEDIHNQVGIQSSAAVADGMVYSAVAIRTYMPSTLEPARRSGRSRETDRG